MQEVQPSTINQKRIEMFVFCLTSTQNCWKLQYVHLLEPVRFSNVCCSENWQNLLHVFVMHQTPKQIPFILKNPLCNKYFSYLWDKDANGTEVSCGAGSTFRLLMSFFVCRAPSPPPRLGSGAPGPRGRQICRGSAHLENAMFRTQ